MTSTTSPPVRNAEWLMREAPELIPAAHIGEVAGLNHETVAVLIDEGTLPVVRLGRRRWIPRQAVLDLLHLSRSA